MSEHTTAELADDPDLRDRIALIIHRDAMEGVSAESTADAVVDAVDQERGKRCRDKDCARILPHGRLSSHMWKHPAEPPFSCVLAMWLCFTCGHRKRHRIHKRMRL
jgi:hypothetical protein